MSAFALARTVSLGRMTSALVAVWIGLLPRIAGIHLDGFLSNVAALFAFPALCGLLAGRRRMSCVRKLLSARSWSAWVLSCYSELIPLAMLNAIALIVFRRDTSLVGRVSVAEIVMTAPWVLFGGYVTSAVRYLIFSYGVGIGPSGFDSLFLQGWDAVRMGRDVHSAQRSWRGVVQRWADPSRLVALTMLALGLCRTPSRVGRSPPPSSGSVASRSRSSSPPCWFGRSLGNTHLAS